MTITTLRSTLTNVVSIVVFAAATSACSNSTSWKEEVLLHDGKKIVVERSISRDPKGDREIGQSAPQSEETLKFTLPGNSQTVAWKSDFGPELQDNLMLLALEIVDGKPYIVTRATRCHAYNKWGRPNPPYVFFKFDGQSWQRIAIRELPKAIQKANVIIGGYGGKEERLRGMGIDVKQTSPHLTSEVVDRFNRDMGGDPDTLRMRLFDREPIKGGETVQCAEMVFHKGAWVGPGDSIGRRIMDRKTQ